MLDIYNGIAVHARGGDRKKYQAVHLSSQVCETSSPCGIIETLNPREVYIADLNILQGEGEDKENIGELESLSSRSDVMLDAGVGRQEDADKWLRIANTLVLGTETASMDVIRNLAARYPGRISVSIDRKNGKLLSKSSDIPENPDQAIEIFNELPLKDIIYLDLDRVGTSSGMDIEMLSRIAKISYHPLLLGGGVRDMADIAELEKAGISGALVATAVHKQVIPVEQLR
ncbi:HisA/HisF-related TIM barrel protein [Methanohalophilus mahii]|uniref:HisA/HisF-related TIM barrel protein n=1 Tax=Methanohalophilus mahii TaxID=2176 RepID=UPI00315CD3C3